MYVTNLFLKKYILKWQMLQNKEAQNSHRDFDVGVGSSELPAHPFCQGCYSVLCRRVKMGFSKTMSR